MTNAQIQALLTVRGTIGAPLIDYTLSDLADGLGPRVTEWNVATLGPLPTQAEIDALTPAQIAAAAIAIRIAQFKASSRQKDVLATIGLIVRAKGLAAWNAMTTAQKVTATLAEADAWTTIRDFIETNI